MNKNSILITIDVEDWFQVENLRPWFPPDTWDKQQSRIEQNTINLLNILDSIKLPNPTNTTNSNNSGNSVRATFFVLGWIAERYPKIVTEIASRGHEVASHGYNHMLCNNISQDELLNDLIKSKSVLEDLTGKKINGYRAPSFSINDDILETIEKAGYTYDSSYNSFDKHGRYGRITSNGHKKYKSVFRINSSFYEMPISNLKILGQTIPWGGGGYFRFIPPTIFKAGVKNIINKKGSYIFYIHPWEIDPNQPRIKTIKGLTTWRHYLNLDKTRSRLRNLLNAFNDCNFITCGHYLNVA